MKLELLRTVKDGTEVWLDESEYLSVWRRDPDTTWWAAGNECEVIQGGWKSGWEELEKARSEALLVKEEMTKAGYYLGQSRLESINNYIEYVKTRSKDND